MAEMVAGFTKPKDSSPPPPVMMGTINPSQSRRDSERERAISGRTVLIEAFLERERGGQKSGLISHDTPKHARRSVTPLSVRLGEL